MAFSNIDNQVLGKFLQIAFSEGIRTQISKDYRDWEMIKRVREGDPDGRELRFLFKRSFGPAAIQYRNPNFTSAFPAAQKSSTSEHSAVYKEVDVTIELEYNLWNRARKSPAKYAEPLAEEILSKSVASKRRLAADLYGDGTGVMGTALSIADAAAADQTVVTLNATNATRGHVGFFEFGDLLLAKTQAGAAQTAPTFGAGTFYAWRVKDKDRANDTVTLEGVDAAGTVLDLTASNIAATNVFYRVGQPTFPDLTAAIPDYGTITEVMAGLESLTANDGRVIHGITMSGATAGTRYSAGGNPLDVSHIQSLMSNVKTAVGQGEYTWKMMVMAPEALDALIESRETDRRFVTVDDHTRGVKKFVYQHLESSIEAVTSEYCPKTRIYMLPEGKAGNKVLEYHGTDFEPVKVNDSSQFNLKPASGGGHERIISTYMEALCVLICKHPAAIGVLHNFTL